MDNICKETALVAFHKTSNSIQGCKFIKKIEVITKELSL